MKTKEDRRNKKRKICRKHWEPNFDDLVLVECPHTYEAEEGLKKKFMGPYEGPFRI